VVSDYERALHAEGRRQLGLFALEGFRLIERALATDTPLTHILIGKSAPNDSSPRLQKILEKLAKQNASVISVPDPVMEKLLEGRTLGPILALAKIPSPLDLPQLFARLGSAGTRNKILVLDEMMDPGNVGALTRTAHAMGVACVVALGGADPFHPRAARTSMGSVFRVPIIRLPDVDSLLPLLRKNHIFTIGATGNAPTLLPKASIPGQTVALFVGNEGKGLSPTIRASLDLLVAIPMSNTIDSFSINAATAVVLYAISHPPNLPSEPEVE
jgi:TrmH family RNA methyltransferase